MRALFEFQKLDRLKFVSHLDLQRFMQMALRRTDIPVAYSQGFNPHPSMSFASALAMGWTSDCEVLEVKLADAITEGEAFRQMSAALPQDMPLRRVRLIADEQPKRMAIVQMSDYVITLSGEGAAAICAAVPGFLAEPSVMALRKTKSGEKMTDIRPWSVSVASKQTEVGYEIRSRLLLTEPATLKPDLLVKTLAELAGVAVPERVRYHRTQLWAVDKQGRAVELFTA